MPTLAELNLMHRAAFTSALGQLFEHSPWVADLTWERRPFSSPEHLHRELCLVMRAASYERKLALLRAHPDLAGRLARQKQLTAASMREQASAGLDDLTDAEIHEFQQLNASYQSRFGFPFIICARLNPKSGILAAMKQRLENPVAAEFATALAEIEKIAQFRLAAALSPSPAS